MEQMIIAYYYDSYERTKEHLIVTKRVGKIPQHGSYIVEQLLHLPVRRPSIITLIGWDNKLYSR